MALTFIILKFLKIILELPLSQSIKEKTGSHLAKLVRSTELGRNTNIIHSLFHFVSLFFLLKVTKTVF